jgi:hypothetical protein
MITGSLYLSMISVTVLRVSSMKFTFVSTIFSFYRIISLSTYRFTVLRAVLVFCGPGMFFSCSSFTTSI